jgi:prophage tail gpP-like protein
MTIKPDEVATIVVGGRRFDDWESVYVQDRWADGWAIFRFTATERDPLPGVWDKLQIKPGDECAIYLGGYLAIVGVVTVRQTAYDANSHGVMLQGVGLTWFAARGSILDKTSSYDNMTFEQVARKVLAPFSVGVRVIGSLDATPYMRLQNEPGEFVWNFLERIARSRGIVMGSDRYGNMLLIGDHASAVVADLVEGDNIKRCQATISIDPFRSQYVVSGQTAATDGNAGRAASEQWAVAGGSLSRYSPLLTPSEHPVWTIGELAARAQHEKVWIEGTEIQATITIVGWLKPGFVQQSTAIQTALGTPSALWMAGEVVSVYSPMAMLDLAMKIQNVTFTQDEASGTLTTFDLVIPWLLKDRGDYNVNRTGVPAAPDAAKGDTSAPTTPQAGKVADPAPDTLDT